MKKIVKNFNNLLKRTIFKVQNKTNNNFKVSGFNKYLITFIALLFFYLFYLLIPLLYDKSWIQANIEAKLLTEFKVNVSTSADISYRILPSPHFLIKDSRILLSVGEKKKSIAEIKDLKIFLSQRNFFNKEKMNIIKLVINRANFSLLRSDIKLLNELTSKKFPKHKIQINNSNIFLKNNLEEIISIIKVKKTTLFFDDEKLLNIFNLKGEIFNIPFAFNFNIRNDSIKYKETNFSSKPLKLVIFNKSTSKKKLTSGENNLSILNSQINTNYSVKKKLITFRSENFRLGNSQGSYEGELSINPFDLHFNVYLSDYKISKIFNINPILIEFIKSGLLFNDNISVNTSIVINTNEKNDIFHNAKINFNIVNGKLNLDNTTLLNNKIGSFELSNSNLFLENNNLILNTNVLFEVRDANSLFSLLNTSKKSRKDFKNILINLNYNFLTDQITFNNVKIDNNDVSNQFLDITESFSDNKSNNFIKSRRLINKLLSIYEG